MQSTAFIGCQGRFLWSLCKVVWKVFRNITRISFGNVYARFPKNHKAILPCKCFASFMQGHFGECMATPKSGLLAIFIEGAPKTKWHCYHAAFWQSLCKFALACTGNLFRYQGLHLLVDRKGFCVLYARSFAKLFFRAILPGKCFVSFIQGHFGEYMATLRPAERGGRRGKISRVQWLLRDKRGHLRRYLGGGNTIIWGAKTK